MFKRNNQNLNVLRPATDPFSLEGGINIVSGNIGTGIVKISSLEKRFDTSLTYVETTSCQNFILLICLAY